MRADQRAFAALNAGIGIPNRNFGGNATFFVLGCACRPGSVDDLFKSRYRQLVAAVGDDFAGELFDKFRSIGRNRQVAVEFGCNG